MLSYMNESSLREFVLNIFRLDDLLKLTANHITAPAGQTGARWQIFNALAETPKTAAEIARIKNVSRQSVQRIVDELVAENVARLIQNPKHKRFPLIDLTSKGQKALRKIELSRALWEEQ